MAAFFLGVTTLSVLTICYELRRGSGRKPNVGWRPLGGTATAYLAIGILTAVLSLVDLQVHHQLFLSLTFFDHGPRISWTESVLRTGIPPDNPFYWYKHQAVMRNYYFWYVLCAVVARTTLIPVQSVLMASCVWSSFTLVSIAGLYLKHFLSPGAQLRKQLVSVFLLLSVSGLDILVHLFNFFVLHLPLPGNSQAWVVGQINSWYVSLLLTPHHVASLVCCMSAFLFAWMSADAPWRGRVTAAALIGLALSSAFGLSLYVTFAFFLLMLAWSIWQVTCERRVAPSLLIACGGILAALLLLPYLRELARNPSGIHGAAPFGFAIRQTVPPDRLLASFFFQHLASAHPKAALNLANLVLLLPGITVELGFSLGVLLIYTFPALRSGRQLDPPRRSLVFIAVAAVLLTSTMRSWVISYNDFGIRGALFLQFALLVLGCEVISTLKTVDRKHDQQADSASTGRIPLWLRSTMAFGLILGLISTFYQACVFRFAIPLVEMAHTRAIHNPVAGNLSHRAYISFLGYRELDRLIPGDAIVQANPIPQMTFSQLINIAGIDHQTAITYDRPWCGAELGGDPSGCPAMIAAIPPLFMHASAETARTVCNTYHIDYLVTTTYDAVWDDKTSWVWTLDPVVSNPEFRALDCHHPAVKVLANYSVQPGN